VSTFFIPGNGEDHHLADRFYADMRAALELELGTRPNGRRIAKLWARHTDCTTEVGMPDPLRGGIVARRRARTATDQQAVFDLSRLQSSAVASVHLRSLARWLARAGLAGRGR